MNTDIEEALSKAAIESFNPDWLIYGGLTSALIIIAFAVTRYVLIRIIRGKKEILVKQQRRWINRINNATTVLILITLVFIWAPQLHTFALSLTAVAVAIVITTKELLMCLTGGFLRASSKPFSVGDWIKVDNVTGEVMRITAMTTSIEEIDTAEKTYQFTGCTIQIPNSKFLTANVENKNFLKDYVYQDVPIIVQYADLDPVILMKKLQAITTEHASAHLDDAIQFNKRVEKKSAVDFADADPQYFLKNTEIGHNIYIVRLLIPTKLAGTISTNITRDFLSYVHKQRTKKQKQVQEKEQKETT